MNKIHSLADVQSTNIGENTYIWQFCVILPQAVIGNDCNICAHVFIENDVVVGNRVTVKNGVQLWEGVHLGDDVFVGPNVTFTNDLVPRSKQYPQSFFKTIVMRGASIGANSTIIAGHTIGEYALIGAGSVVTKDVPAYTVWVGNPAKCVGTITKEGVINKMKDIDMLTNINGGVKSSCLMHSYRIAAPLGSQYNGYRYV